MFQEFPEWGEEVVMGLPLAHATRVRDFRPVKLGKGKQARAPMFLLFPRYSLGYCLWVWGYCVGDCFWVCRCCLWNWGSG